MMIDFFDAFGKDTDAGKDIPKEVLELLDKKLPENLMYIQDDCGGYEVVPRPETKEAGLKLTTRFDLDEALLERLKRIPPKNWWDYFYKRKKPIPIKNLRIGNDEKMIPVEKTFGNPFQENEGQVTEAKMYPQRFPDPIIMAFESADGYRADIAIQQQAYDSVLEVKFGNVNYPALKLEIYHYAPLLDVGNTVRENCFTSAERPFHLIFSVMPSKAQSVSEAISALHIFHGLLTGTAKINGNIVSPEGGESTLTSEQLDEILDFWETALKLEELLKVSFLPSADFPMRDVQLFNELRICLIEKKELTWKHPFNHFHLDGYRPINKEQTLESWIGKEGICYKFEEGPIRISLLGAEFDVFSRSEIKDFVISNIEWDDENNQGCEVYITDAPGRVLTLSRLYITQEEYISQK